MFTVNQALIQVDLFMLDKILLILVLGRFVLFQFQWKPAQPVSLPGSDPLENTFSLLRQFPSFIIHAISHSLIS
jgi:hypothetical protein